MGFEIDRPKTVFILISDNSAEQSRPYSREVSISRATCRFSISILDHGSVAVLAEPGRSQ
jgi:hypothetical protein